MKNQQKQLGKSYKSIGKNLPGVYISVFKFWLKIVETLWERTFHL
jgi:hypothetical protein